MKKLSFLFAIAVLISSCSLIESIGTDLIDEIQNATTVEVAADQLPEDAQSYLDENHFDTYIDVVNFAEGLGYHVELGTGENVFFNEDGEKLEKEGKRGRKGHRGHKGKDLEPIEISDLSSTITDYVANNYPDATIVRAKTDEEGNIYVGLDSHIILEFDAEGNFVGEFEHHRRGKGEKIDLSELPTVITDYITENYPNSELKVAFKKEDGYGVGIVTSDDERKVLIFDADGNFVAEKTCNGK